MACLQSPTNVLHALTPYEGRTVFVTVAGETIEATYRHPFFVRRGRDLANRTRLEHLPEVPKNATTEGRWVDAGDLRVGDELVLLDGRIRQIKALRVKPYNADVYNFEVEDLHCYVVGRQSILVHNTNGDEGTRNPAQDKMLSKGEIKKLQDSGFDIHDLKGGKNASRYDLYKDAQGNIYVKPKGGAGPGDRTGININGL